MTVIGTQNVQNNIQNNIQNTFIVVGGNGPPSRAPPGWPKKWPPPPPGLRPFFPPNFTVPLGLLSRATATAMVADAEGCKKGEPKAVARLMTEIVKQVHRNPAERNMYLNPTRSDQVLALTQAEGWSVLTLNEGTTMVFTRVASEMGETMPFMEAKAQAVARKARDGFQERPSEVVRNSRALMATHLENVASRLGREGRGCWLGEIEGGEAIAMESEPTRTFGQERHIHISGDTVVLWLDMNSGVERAEDLTAEKARRVAEQAIEALAKLILRRRPENLTIICGKGGATYVCVAGGWEERPAAAVAAEQVRGLAELLRLYIVSQESKFYAPLAAFLARAENVADLAQEESSRLRLLTHYAQSAAQYYATTTSPHHEKARQLVLADAGALDDSDRSLVAGQQ